MRDVVQRLREQEVEVDVLDLDQDPTDLGNIQIRHDLYLLHSVTEASLSFAGILESLGASVLNTCQVTRTLRDKALTTGLLQRAGVPVPDTYLAQRPIQLIPLLDTGPLVVKPYYGSRGDGVRMVCNSDELFEATPNERPVFAQRYHEPQGLDRKLYCIGGEVFGVKRVFPANSYAEKLGESFTVTPELRAIVLRCGEALGIDLFGVDVVISQGQPYVVDASSFPGFKGVPDAALCLADYVYDTAARTAS
jgi:ribosomal protein S6--L-glutamate ligase